MWGKRTREEQAQLNKGYRIDLYKKATFWAALGGIGPIGFFLNENVLNTPKPISATFEGFQSDGAPMGDTYEVYSYDWASTSDHALSILGFVLGVFAAVAVALAFYCIARFIADPIMYKIDMKIKEDSPQQLWLKRIVMILVVLLYCSTMAFAAEYDAYPEDEYVWLSDGKTYIRVDKDEYDKYMNDKDSSGRDNQVKEETTTTRPTESTTEHTTEDLSKTPVERGYPSNDLQYYIDHPDEPMPQELINELVEPDSYNPGMDYNDYPY